MSDKDKGSVVADAVVEMHGKLVKYPDLVIPWAFAVNILKMQIMSVMMRRGKSIEEIYELVRVSIDDKPSDELYELVTQLMGEAELTYKRNNATPKGVGLLRKNLGMQRKGSRRK